MPLRHPSAKLAPITLLSDFLPRRVKPPLQPSEVNTPPLPQLSALHLDVRTTLSQISHLPLQRGVPLL